MLDSASLLQQSPILRLLGEAAADAVDQGMILVSAAGLGASPFESALDQLSAVQMRGILLDLHAGEVTPAGVPDAVAATAGDGAFEGRALSSEFILERDYTCYAQQNEDLLKKYCRGALAACDWKKIARHWQQKGRAEGRRKECAASHPAGSWQAGPLRAVNLFDKSSSGQLVLVKEGLDVLRSQTEPFAIISALGPTRTGKSTILGRAFLRGRHENLFRIGSGVTSFTGGVQITSEPIRFSIGVGRPPLRAFLVDTEGFSGVGSVTSRSYEAHLFAIIYLLSNAVIFNSMFPVDSSTASFMSQQSVRSLQMLKSLHEADIPFQRRLPRFIWCVQSFNMHNLQNTGISAAQLFSHVKNSSSTTPSDTPAIASLLRSSGSSSSSAGLVEQLFESPTLVPVRRLRCTVAA